MIDIHNKCKCLNKGTCPYCGGTMEWFDWSPYRGIKDWSCDGCPNRTSKY